VWKEIVGAPLDPDTDLETSDKFMHQMFEQMREQARSTETEQDFQLMIGEQCFTIDFGLGETELVPGGSNIAVTKANLEQYIKMASLAILRKSSVQMKHFLSGVYFVAQKDALKLLSWQNAEVRAMGEATIDIGVLRAFTRDETVSNSH